jgi:hypothetical protein
MNNKNILPLSLILILLSSFLIFSFGVKAATFNDINGFLEQSGSASGYETGNDATVIIGQIIKTLLGIVGVIFVVLIVYGGFLWMTAETGAGKNQLDKAKKVLTMAIIGLLIIILAYGITSFVISAINKSTQGSSAPVTLLLK